MSRPNPASKLALIAFCPHCYKERRVVRIHGDAAELAICGHSVPRAETYR